VEQAKGSATEPLLAAQYFILAALTTYVFQKDIQRKLSQHGGNAMRGPCPGSGRRAVLRRLQDNVVNWGVGWGASEAMHVLRHF
jgi:hypothetical protein